MNLNKKISMALNVITTIELIAFCCGLIGVDYRLDMIGETNKCLKREYHEKGDRWFEACKSISTFGCHNLYNFLKKD